MSVKIKFDEDELKAKKVFTKIENASNTVYTYKQKNKTFIKNKDNSRSKEVVTKITGNSKNFDVFKRHIEYITREYKLPLYDNEGNKYEGKEEIKEFVKNYNFDDAIPQYKELKGKERREVMNFVFSMKEHNTTPPDKLIKAVIKTIKEKYPDNPVCFSYHGDTDNPHVHCDLRIQDINGNRIDLKHKDRYDLRREFAKNLKALGIEAYATRKWENYILEKNTSSIAQEKELSKVAAKENKIKNHHYEVVDFGKAKYKFDEKNSNSYFVSYKTTKGEIATIWSKELEKVIKENDIQPGEFVRFKIVDKEPVTKTIRKVNQKTKKREVFTKTSFKNIWDCSILGRAEKDLKDILKKSDTKISYSYEENQLTNLQLKSMQFVKNKNTISSNKKLDKFNKKNNLER